MARKVARVRRKVYRVLPRRVYSVWRRFCGVRHSSAQPSIAEVKAVGRKRHLEFVEHLLRQTFRIVRRPRHKRRRRAKQGRFCNAAFAVLRDVMHRRIAAGRMANVNSGVRLSGYLVVQLVVECSSIFPIEIPWSMRSKRDLARIDNGSAEPGTSSTNPAILQALIRAHVWLRQLMDGTYESIEALAKAADIHPKVVRSRIKLAFLSPSVIRTILTEERPVPSALNNELFKDVPLSWHEQ